MTWYDWLILILPVCFVMYMGFYTRRYVRGVPDFLSAGRLCGRYVISMGDVANSLSIIEKSGSDLPIIELPDGSVKLFYDLYGRPQPTIQPNQIHISPHQKSIHTQ